MAARSRVEVREPDHERHRRERREIVLAEERGLPGAEVVQPLLDRPDVCSGVHRHECEDDQPGSLAGVDHVDRTERQRRDLDELPARDERVAPVERGGDEDPAREYARRGEHRPRPARHVSSAHGAPKRPDAEQNECDVGRCDRKARCPCADGDVRLIGRPDQRDEERDEKGNEERITQRTAQIRAVRAERSRDGRHVSPSCLSRRRSIRRARSTRAAAASRHGMKSHGTR